MDTRYPIQPGYLHTVSPATKKIDMAISGMIFGRGIINFPPPFPVFPPFPGEGPLPRFIHMAHPGGRPTKFTPGNKIKAEKLCRRGFTDKEIAEIIDINESTIHRWKLKQPGFSESLNLWKQDANHNIERSLYERAHGYSHAATKAQWIQDENGGRWEYADLIKHYPPDPTSMIFWLKNRCPEKWRDKTEVRHSLDEPLIDIVRKLRNEKK